MRVHRCRNRDRQVGVLAMGLVWAALLLCFVGEARGEPASQPEKIDDDPQGAPYASGELIVVYEPGTPESGETAVVRETGGRTVKNLAEQEARLISFPNIKEEGTEGARETALERERQNLEEDPRVEEADYNYLREASFIPNDPKFGGQWGLRKADFNEAWNDGHGRDAGRSVKIAVVDSGVSKKHPDLRAKVGAQRDFVHGDAKAQDDFGHGTSVAGIAAAATDNKRGIAGGCPGCKLLVAKVLNSNGKGFDSDVVEGIEWSVDHGADVVNLSLGGPQKSKVLERAVNDAWRRGVVVVAAAGNGGTNQRFYPAAYPKVIAVSATTRTDRLAGFSNYGSWVDLAAPGVHILSTIRGDRYGVDSGTSFSTPFVSALAGLLASQKLSAPQIRGRMENTAEDLGSRGRDPYYGEGRINAAKAVR